MTLTQEQIDEIYAFQAGLSESEEYLFWNLSVAVKDKRGGTAVMFEDKYEIMQRWDEFKRED